MGVALLVIAIAAVIAFAVWSFSESTQLRRQLRKAPVRRIAELGDGQHGKVIGRARVIDHGLVGPLTGRACVYFCAIVEERRQSGKSSYWKTIAREEQIVRFALDDDGGRAIVDANAAKMLIDFDDRSHSGTFDDPNETERAFLQRHGEKGQGWIFNRTLRYREAIIADGETIAVLGAGTREPDPDQPPTDAYRGEQPTRLRLTSSPKYPLVISDERSALISRR